MNPQKSHFSIYILIVILLLALQSCEKKPLKTAQKENNRAEIDTIIAVAHKHFKNGKFDSSYYYFNKAKCEAIVTNDTSRIIHSLSFMAETELKHGDYSASETTITEALQFIKNTKKYPYGTWNIYNALAHNYMFNFDYKNAIKYHNKASKLKVDEIQKAISKNNIAWVYMDMQDYQKAIQILLPLTLEKEFINYEKKYIILDNLGYSYFKLGDSKAIHYLTESLKLRKIKKDDWGLITSYMRLAEFYLEKNPSLAFKYSRLAYDKATKIKDINDRMISLTLLIKSSEGSQSKKYALDYVRINDSITKVRQIAKNQFAKLKYDSKKEKEENQTLKTQKAITELELERHKYRNLLLYFLLVIGILSTVFLYYFLKALNKKEKVKTTIETENRISKKLHDELANDVYSTLSFAETQDLSFIENKEILLNNLDTIYSRTRDISKEISDLDTGIHFANGLKEMMSGFNNNTINILLNGIESINWDRIENNNKIIIYRVLQELLVNMKKHSQCSLVVITFKNITNYIQIDYSDNGIGFDFEKIKSKKGLQNLENRILAIKGTITFDTKPGKGFKSSFTIPYN
jgi:signal transduction histidine kinase